MSHEFYRTARPNPALRPFIEGFWAYLGYRPSHAVERVVPSGCVELVIGLRGQRLEWRELSGQAGCSRAALLQGPRRTAFDVPTAQQCELVGVRFRQWGAWPLLGAPMHELAEDHHDLDGVVDSTASAELTDRLLHASSDQERWSLLDGFFLRRLDSLRPTRPLLAASIHAAGSVADAVARSGLSHRRFIELFRREMGLTPRDYLRLRRFRTAYELAVANPTDGADIAFSAGYADQSHWILECRKHVGLSPTALRAGRCRADGVPPQERGQMLPIR